MIMTIEWFDPKDQNTVLATKVVSFGLGTAPDTIAEYITTEGRQAWAQTMSVAPVTDLVVDCATGDVLVPGDPLDVVLAEPPIPPDQVLAT